jgi:hypothetical protein
MILNPREELIVGFLREIQNTLAQHGEYFHRIDQCFDRMERRLGDIHEGMITSLGRAAHARVRRDRMQKDLNDLKKRVRRLEEKR